MAAAAATDPATSAAVARSDSEWIRRRPGKMFEGTHYVLTGPAPQGPRDKLVVCVPGIGGMHMYFEELEPALVAQGYRVLRYDLMGRGWSDPAPGHERSKPPGCCGGCVPLEEDPYSLEGHVQQLHRLLLGLNLVTEGDSGEAGASAVGGDAANGRRLSVSMSGSRQWDVDASTSSSVSTHAHHSSLDTSQTWPQQQPPRAGTSFNNNTSSTSSSHVIGPGGLPSVPEAVPITAPADHTLAAAAAKPVRHIHLVGHSMGGAIAVGFADRYPELVASLTLLTPAGLMDPGQFRLLRALPCCIQRVVQANLRRHVNNAVRNDFLVHGTPLEERVLEMVRVWVFLGGRLWVMGWVRCACPCAKNS
jgi:pimeloyl-ACP methyl ester carboxylesterase